MIFDARSLPYGKFYGTDRFFSAVPGFSVTVMNPILRAEDVPLHTHEDASFVLVLKGSYVSSADGAGPLCGPGTLIYNPPGTTHRDRFQTLGGCFLAVSVCRESLGQAGCETVPGNALAFRRGEIVSCARRLAAECGRLYPDSALQLESACLEMLSHVAIRPRARYRKPPSWIARAKEIMRERCSGTVRLAAIAGCLDIHPVHLARGFRQFLGCTPGEYLMRCRMEKAVTILRATNLPLVDTALRAGFCDQSHFSNAFRRQFGLSPLAYRRIVRPACVG